MDPYVHKIHEQTYKRGHMLDSFSIFEEIFDMFLSHHAFPVQPMKPGGYVSFKNKKDAVKRIMRGQYPELHESFPWQELSEVEKMRDFAAHAARKVEFGYVKNQDTGVVEFLRGEAYYASENGNIKVCEVEEKYYDLRPVVLAALFSLPGLTDLDLHTDPMLEIDNVIMTFEDAPGGEVRHDFPREDKYDSPSGENVTFRGGFAGS